MKHILPLLLICISLWGNAQNITPVKGNASKYSFTCANLYFEVDTAFGGRITSFKINNDEILFTTGDNRGSTFWPSPQSVWNWPPLTAIDSKNYSGRIVDNKLVLKGSIDNTTKLRCYKIICANSEDTSITIQYIIKNENTSAKKWAPWEVTRVPGKGLTFFGSGDGSVTGNMAKNTSASLNCTWYDQDKTTPPSGTAKFFSDGKGWIAHVYNNRIFVKKFEDISATSAATGESEIEVYTASDKSYTEVENQGAYQEIKANDSLKWVVKWYARALPVGIESSVNENLANFAKLIMTNDKAVNLDIPAEQQPSVNVINNENNSANFQLYPNPASEILTLKAALPLYNDVTFHIFDMQGKSVLKQAIAQNLSQVNISKLAQGQYVYELKFGQNKISSGQFFITR